MSKNARVPSTRRNLRSQGPPLCTHCSFFSSSRDLLCSRHRDASYEDAEVEHVRLLREAGCDVQSEGGRLYLDMCRALVPTSARATLLAFSIMARGQRRAFMATEDANRVLALVHRHFGADERALTAIGARVVTTMACPWRLDIEDGNVKSTLLCYYGAYGEAPVVGTPLGLAHHCFNDVSRERAPQPKI